MGTEFGITTISVFVGTMNQAVKFIASTYFKKDIGKYIPILSVVFGILLGVAGYYIPNVYLGDNIITAIFTGASAGSAATGVHQIAKQLSSDSPVQTQTEEVVEDCDCEPSLTESEEESIEEMLEDIREDIDVDIK